jgi:hypothetical protein
MLYILESDYPTQANWHNDFSENLFKALVPLVEVTCIRRTNSVKGLSVKDYVFVTHYADLDNPIIQETKAKIIFHHHGSGVSPYMHYVDRKLEKYHVENTIDINTFCLPTQHKLIAEKYNITDGVTIGFPLNFDKYKPYSNTPKKKKIVVAGHIGPERQFYLSTYLLKDLLQEYEVVFSICEKPDCVTGKWSTFYDLDRFREMGFKFVFCPEQEGFYKELSDASHIFTCSLGDVISISVVEGSLIGCIPVVPNIRNYWPMFMDFVTYGYHPFSKQNIEYTIINYKGYKAPMVNPEWFDPKLVVERLLEKLI